MRFRCFRVKVLSPRFFFFFFYIFVSKRLSYLLPSLTSCVPPFFLLLYQDLCVPSFLPLLDSVLLFPFSNVPESECL